MPEEETDLNELRKEFHQKKRDLVKLRFQLNTIHSQKEEAFHGLRSTQDKIRSKLKQVKSLRETRDTLTKQVKTLKEEREKLNQGVKEKAGKKKEVDQKKQELIEQIDFKGNPAALKRQIDQMETRLETELMPFTKEQQLRKTVKELRVQYKEISQLGTVWKEVNTASADFSEMRRKAQDTHHEVQKIAETSQEKHQEIQKIYDELHQLKEQEQPLAEKHLHLKVEYESVKKSFEEIQSRVNELGKLFKDEEEKDFKSLVREKTAQVQDKLKKGKKLSTEDILAFQASKE